MKVLITTLNIIIALYLFLLANFLFWAEIAALFTGSFSSATPTNLSSFTINLFLAPFLIYGMINFFRGAQNKYTYSLVLLAIAWAGATVPHLILAPDHSLAGADLNNLLFFGIPFLVIYGVKYLSTKYPLKS